MRTRPPSLPFPGRAKLCTSYVRNTTEMSVISGCSRSHKDMDGLFLSSLTGQTAITAHRLEIPTCIQSSRSLDVKSCDTCATYHKQSASSSSRQSKVPSNQPPPQHPTKSRLDCRVRRATASSEECKTKVYLYLLFRQFYCSPPGQTFLNGPRLDDEVCLNQGHLHFPTETAVLGCGTDRTAQDLIIFL